MKKLFVILGCIAALSTNVSNAALINLSDDSFTEVSIGFDFEFFGNTYSDVFINSNGSLSFGGGDTDWSESVSDFLNDDARIAVWDDFNPASGGTIETVSTASSFSVVFTDLPQFGNVDANSFSFTLFDNDSFEIVLASMTSTDMLIGITSGNGDSDPGESDLSSLTGPFATDATMYELFSGDFDLANGTVLSFGNTPQSVLVPAPATISILALGLLVLSSRRVFFK